MLAMADFAVKFAIARAVGSGPTLVDEHRAASNRAQNGRVDNVVCHPDSIRMPRRVTPLITDFGHSGHANGATIAPLAC